MECGARMKKLIVWLVSYFTKATPLNAAQIISAVDIELRQVSVPEWGGFVYLRSLSVDARIKYLARISSVLAKQNSPTDANNEYHEAQVYLLSQSLSDEKGNLIFAEADVQSLSKKSPVVLSRLCDEILLTNGFQVNAVEDAAKK